MKKVLMCPPDYFNVNYIINPWMKENVGKVDRELAESQWNALYEAVKKYATVDLIYGTRSIPDLVFTANAGFSINEKLFLLSNFKKEERKKEEERFKRHVEEELRLEVIRTIDSYEGQGDHLVDGQELHWVGYGFRTSKGSKWHIDKYTGRDTTYVELVDSRFYHLDTCFFPLPDGELVWYPDAFGDEAIDVIKKNFSERIELTEEQALEFAANGIAFDKNVLMPISSVSDQIRALGYTVEEFDMSEFKKAGGAVKCLILNLN